MGPKRLAWSVLALLLVAPVVARADALIQLAGDPPITFSGTTTYGAVYLDGEVRLAGDATIHATSIYVGPDARLRPCFVTATGDDTCAAGRALTVTAAGAVWIVPDIDLRPASAGPGGSLTVTGSTVTLASIDTRGIAAPSGPVTLTARASLVFRDVTASGAAVQLVGRDVSSSGDVSVAGGDLPGGGSVAARSPGAVVLGSLDASGAGGGTVAPGGDGGQVSLSGAAVRLLRASVDGGSSDVAAGGRAGSITITSTGRVTVSGLSLGGGRGATGPGLDGGVAAIDALGDVSVGELLGDGGGADGAGGAGASVTLAGDAVTVDRIFASGVDAGTGGVGGHGGALRIEAGDRALVGSAYLDGGRGATDVGGAGGSLVARAASASIGQAFTDGGATLSSSAGAAGGQVTVTAPDAVAIGRIETAGGDAGDGAGARGGDGGAVQLSSMLGDVRVTGTITTIAGRGGAGPADGGVGGAAGAIDLVGLHVARLGGVYAYGGSGGQGAAASAAGGPGARVRWFGPGDLFDGSWVLANAGGDGTPVGVEGATEDHGAPRVSVARGRITARSSAASSSGLVVVESIGGGRWFPVRALPAGGLAVPAPAHCFSIRVAVADTSLVPAWTGPPALAATVHSARSRQGCASPPAVRVDPVSVKARALRAAAWTVSLTLRTGGSAVISRVYLVSDRDRTLVGTVLAVVPGTRPGVTFRLPPWARHAGTYRVELAVRAASGVASRGAVGRIVIRPG
jgi:hypothetical protein